MIPPDKIINNLRVTLELVISAHPDISFHYNLTTLVVFKPNGRSQIVFLFMDNHIRILITDRKGLEDIKKYTYDDPKLEQYLTAIIAEWI